MFGDKISALLQANSYFNNNNNNNNNRINQTMYLGATITAKFSEVYRPYEIIRVSLGITLRLSGFRGPQIGSHRSKGVNILTFGPGPFLFFWIWYILRLGAANQNRLLSRFISLRPSYYQLHTVEPKSCVRTSTTFGWRLAVVAISSTYTPARRSEHSAIDVAATEEELQPHYVGPEVCDG